MYFIGLMSGTSMDAVDAALVKFHKSGLGMDIVAYRQYPINEELQQRVRAVNISTSLEEISELDNILGHEFANAVMQILNDGNIDKADILAVGNHGQTVLHLPDSKYPRTMQIGDPNIICQHTGITTVADFRRADMVVSGQGAPLAPAFHAWYFNNTDKNTVVMNLGGIANMTLLYQDDVTGFDSGPGNGLMDQWIQKKRNLEFDENGAWALSGKCHTELLQLMLEHTYFTSPPPKSTGKDDFNLEWLNILLAKLNTQPADEDIQATLLELSIQTIVNAIKDYAPEADEIVMCGGGIHNSALVDGLQQRLSGIELSSSAKYGLDPDAVEAVAFAWLAKQRLEEQPGNLPSVTGASRPVILGAVYQP